MNVGNGEKIIKEGSANFAKSKFNKVGGTLYITNRRLVFEAHGLNFGGKTKIDLELSQLVRCQSGKTSLISGEIEIFDKYTNKYVFVVYNRKDWANCIEDAIIDARNSYSQTPEKIVVRESSSNDKVAKLRDLKELRNF